MSKGTLGQVKSALNGWLKPKLLGESWDNIGLLVGSGRYAEDEKPVNNILLCNDLTTKVVYEAISKKIDIIIAYNPSMFAGVAGSWKEQIVIVAKCLAHDIAIYSPHTTLDAVIGGINDRIMNAFHSEIQSVALCIGSGASILKGLMFGATVTGEMTLHDVLDCCEAQRSRGFGTTLFTDFARNQDNNTVP